MLLFVYGSLMAGEQHHDRLRGARRVAVTRTAPCFELYRRGAYPTLVAGGATAVRGEVYEVDAALLAELDAFEDVPHLYRRQAVALEEGSAEAYLATDAAALDPTARIVSGDWRLAGHGRDEPES